MSIHLFHYTLQQNVPGISEQGILPSVKRAAADHPDASQGIGVYFTDLPPNRLASQSRTDIAQALFDWPERWSDMNVRIAWLEVSLPADMVNRVADLYPGVIASRHPHYGIWQVPGMTIVAPTYITDVGLLKV